MTADETAPVPGAPAPGAGTGERAVAEGAVAEGAVVESAAAACGPLAMEAIAVNKDFRLGRGHTVHAVRQVSLSLYRGGVVALVGESGSGKSTVARLLAGQERLTSGTIRLDGQQVDVSSRRAFRHYKSEVQLVFQDPFSSLNPVHTVGYHLERPVRLHQGKTSRAEVGKEVSMLLEQVRLTPADRYLGKFPHELSGGQRQRVSFARALAARPRVLLADEPVSMLDVSIRLEMLSMLDDLRRRLQLALLYITHDIASARYFADEVIVLYAGEVVERGPAEDVTQHPAHPYTQLLVASAPDPDQLGSMLRAGPRIDGRKPGSAAGAAATGCPFNLRCPFADDQCRREVPALQRVAADRAAACFHLDAAAPNVLAGQQGGGDITT
jgi:peptide/nickel transport system ATP-binding protein